VTLLYISDSATTLLPLQVCCHCSQGSQVKMGCINEIIKMIIHSRKELIVWITYYRVCLAFNTPLSLAGDQANKHTIVFQTEIGIIICWKFAGVSIDTIYNTIIYRVIFHVKVNIMRKKILNKRQNFKV
jgi:hypothetical protein